MEDQVKDLFICHASEDKEEVVRPLIEAFRRANISTWYDEAEIRWGDSITEKINEGLRISRYVIVVLSPAFLLKKWPQRELNSALSIEASTGEIRALPLLVGTKKEQADIRQQYPLLNDKAHIVWSANPGHVVQHLLKRLEETTASSGRTVEISRHAEVKSIPLPKLKKQFSQRDRDLFLRQAFIKIRDYFRSALTQLERHNNEVETDVSDEGTSKFITTIYIRGEVAQRCKIWLGGLISSDSIAYLEGRSNLDSDNSMNDWLSVRDNEETLGFQPSGMSFGIPQSSNLLTAEQAAEYLWRRFTQRLNS